MKQGPIVIGLYFQKVYDDYRPIFISYPLWKDSLKDCMQFYIFPVSYTHLTLPTIRLV